MESLQDIIKASGKSIEILLAICVGLAILVFFWGLMTFLFKAGDESSHTEGKNKMIWGLIGLFVIFSLWGLVYFLQVAFGLEPYAPPVPPIRTTPQNVCTTDSHGITLCTPINL
jgi:hypothetical protein